MRHRVLFVSFFFQTFIRKHRKPIIISCIAGFLATLFFILIFPFINLVFANPDVRIGEVGIYSSEKALPTHIQNLISLGLTSLTPTGDATPSIARSWEIEESGKKYTFNLRSDLVWHDGKKFTSRDINYALKGATFTPIDDYTLKIALSDPYAPLPVLLAAPMYRGNMFGLGQYQVTGIKSTEGIIYELVLTPIDKQLPKRIYTFYPAREQAVLAFKLGEIDILEHFTEKDAFASWKNVTIHETVQYDRFVGLFFNLEKQTFKEKDIRHALSYAIPALPDAVQTVSPISPLSWAYSSKIRLYSYDPEAAKKILAKSPLASESAAITLSTLPSLIRTAQTIADSWNAVGVKTHLRVENTVSSDYDIFLLPQAIPSDPDQYHFWQSTQDLTNITKYNNPKIDQLLEVGRKTIDKEARIKIYADFQRYLVDDLPVIFLYYPKSYTVERK